MDDDTYDATRLDLPTSLPSRARLAHGTILVTGGVLAGLGFEFAARPFDNARRLAWEHRTASHGSTRAVLQEIRSNGAWDTLFATAKDAAASATAGPISGKELLQRRALMLLRTLGRLGPWGVGFLLWEGLAVRDGDGAY